MGPIWQRGFAVGAVARAALLIALGCATACGSTSSPAAAKSDQDATQDAGQDAAKLADSVTGTAGPSWLGSLSVCWVDMGCPRAFVISHGGDWAVGKGRPYDSKAAFVRAYEQGADGIKTDFLVSKDNVGIVAHSSPINVWESAECQGKLIEAMNASEVTACHLFDSPTTTETYQRVGDVIEWARGKTTLMLTVKSPAAFARAIETILEHKAQDFVHIETHMGDLAVIKQAPNWQKVRYTVQIGALSDIDALLAEPQVLFCEMTPSYAELDAAGLASLIAGKVHGAGMRAFVSSQNLPSVAQHQALWNAGFDVVMTYTLATAMEARKAVNAARGVVPP